MPNEAERASAAYGALAAKIAADQAEAERVGKMMRAISAQDNAGATGAGSTLTEREQSLLDDLFGDDVE